METMMCLRTTLTMRKNRKSRCLVGFGAAGSFITPDRRLWVLPDALMWSCVCLFSHRRPWRNRPEDLWYPALPVGHRAGHGGRTHRVAQPADQAVPRHVHCAVQRALPHHTQDWAGTHSCTSVPHTGKPPSPLTHCRWSSYLCVSTGAPCSTTRQRIPPLTSCLRAATLPRVPPWRAAWTNLQPKSFPVTGECVTKLPLDFYFDSFYFICIYLRKKMLIRLHKHTIMHKVRVKSSWTWRYASCIWSLIV